ncbi:adenylate/guanylate cyclase domain-containing protein [Pilimelia columellifera]|uniref:Guanylate cyclase domain-containing protein n=1 Tax=Pilimelia columellifera subsp. columellifera TaxID=706583 RepID=A0ABN3ND27_9ACTN
MTCPRCGTVAVPGARYCHHCGLALALAATLPIAERRVVTVLFGDLSDFTSWSEDVDPERVGAVTDRVLASLAGAVKTYGGHVDKLTGDGIMAVFGAPVAHEDDAERAIRAALSMQRSVRRVLDDERGGGAPLGLRVGLNTGEVVAGVQAAIEYTVIGDTVNTAARLADAAAVGAVYAGAATATATRHLASWRQLRALRLKGKRVPVETFELLGLHDAPGTRPGLGDEAPFVGRESDLGRFVGRLAEVVDRREPYVMLLTAEAGTGKSRFAAEAQRAAADYEPGPGPYAGRPARVLAARCAAFGERRLLAPLADLVRSAIGLPADTTEARPAVEDRFHRLAARLGRGGERALPTDLLLGLLGFGEVTPRPPADEDRPGAAAPDATDAVSHAVAELLSALTEEGPLLVVIDDLHDATPDALAAIGDTLSRLSGPVLTLLLGRPELVRTAGALTGIADAEVRSLPPLRGADAARLLSAYLGGGRLPQGDTDALLATAQGNPFYLAELVTLLIERGALTEAASQADAGPVWRLAAGSLGSRLLSRDLAAVLAARIDSLPGDARSVLRDAAVVGDTVPGAVLEALRERRGGRLGAAAAELERALDDLLQRRMLHRVRGGYAFLTPLMRQAAYVGIGKADLAQRHAFLGRWAATCDAEAAASFADLSAPALPEPDEELGRDLFVAYHVERAAALADEVGLRADAVARQVRPLGVAALGRCARRAVAAGEPGPALGYAERAMALAGEALSAADQLVYARALLQVGRVGEASTLVEKLTADEIDDADRAQALLLAGRAARVTGDIGRAERQWAQALAVATAADLPAPRTEAMRRLGMLDYLSGRLTEAAARFTEAYEIAEAAGDRRSQAWSLQNLAWVTTARADFAGAETALARASTLYSELGDPVGQVWLRGTTAFTRLLAGRLLEARRLSQAFLPAGERVGDGWAVGTLRAVNAFAAAELGELGEADREARRAYRDFAAVGDDWGRGFALVVRGAVARDLAEPEHARDLLAEALRYCERVGHPLLLGLVRTVRGLVALEGGDLPGAEGEARAALAVAGRDDALPAAVVGPRALLAAARLAGGDAAGASRLLAPVAQASGAPSLLYARRQAVALYARALLAAGRVDEALSWARQAVLLPGEDVRSGVVATRTLAEVLAVAGDLAAARGVAKEAVRLAYATEQTSERAATDAVAAQLAVGDAD